MKNLSESLMGRMFLKRLRGRKRFKCFPKFSRVFPEVNCQQGKPDFIAITGKVPRRRDVNKLWKASQSNSTTSMVHILSLLNHCLPHTMSYIIGKTGYSKSTVQRALHTLIKHSLVEKTPTDSYTLISEWNPPTNELWAFELKLNKWRRGLFQALQCKSYAAYVVVVFPPSSRKVLNANIDKFRRFGVGVLLFDPCEHTYLLLQKPRKNSPTSRRHCLYAFSQMRL